MQLQRLTGLERQKILDELAEILKTIERLRAILSSDKLLMDIVVRELREIREKYGDDRRTEIIAEEGEFRIEDLIAEEDMAITVSNTGYIKRTAITSYRNQRRGGKGRIGMRTREEDFVSHLFVASTHAYIMIFSDRGRAYWLKVHEIPDVGPDGRGKAIANLVSMQEGERIAALLAVKEFEENKFIVMGTKRGEVKKTELERLQQPARRRDHRDGRRRGRRGDRRPGVRRQQRDLHRHAQRDVDPVQGDRRPVDGPHRRRRPRHRAAGTTTKSWRWKCSNRAAPSSRSPSRATASAPSWTNTASSRAAASASSTSRPAIATARSSAWPRCTTTTS